MKRHDNLRGYLNFSAARRLLTSATPAVDRWHHSLNCDQRAAPNGAVLDAIMRQLDRKFLGALPISTKLRVA